MGGQRFYKQKLEVLTVTKYDILCSAAITAATTVRNNLPPTPNLNSATEQPQRKIKAEIKTAPTTQNNQCCHKLQLQMLIFVTLI